MSIKKLDGIRAKIAASGTTTGAVDSAVVIRGNAVQQPLA